MNFNAETYRHIDLYLAGELQGEALQSFEAQLTVNPDLAQAVAEVQIANELLVELEFAQALEEFKSTQKDAPNPRKNIGLFSILGILLTTGVILWRFATPEVDEPLQIEQETSKPEVSIEEHTAPETDPEVPSSVKAEPVVDLPQETKVEPITPSTPEKLLSSNPEPVQPESEEDLLVTSLPEVEMPEERDAPTDFPKERIPDETRLVAPAEIPDPCAGVQLFAETRAWEACEGETNGRIEILTSTISGGEGPYSFALDGGVDQISPEFMELGSGSYTILLMDAMGCSGDLKVKLSEKRCVKREEVSINPDFGEFWVIQNDSEETCSVMISNRRGQKVFSADILEGEVFKWQGISASGQQLPTGTYIFQKKCGLDLSEGTITILR